jgi:antitoxin VapB
VTPSTVFYNNRTQAVRLPKAVALPSEVTQVSIQVVGSSRIITPVGSSWDAWFDRGLRVSDDFLSDRDQGVADERESL